MAGKQRKSAAVKLKPTKLKPIKLKPIKLKPIKLKPIKIKPIQIKPIQIKPVKPRPVKLGPRFLRAFLYAAKKHAREARKASTIPYVAHLMGVASLVLEFGGDENLAIAALLHDVVEDCGGEPMLKEIRHRFGPRAATIVDGCTDSYTIPKPPWRERKETYLRHLKTADAETRLVSAADKLNNVRSILSDYREVGESIWARFNGGRAGTLWYYRALVDEFLRRKPNRLSRELQLAVQELESAAELASAQGFGS